MARYKPYDYCQTQLVPVSLGDQLVPGTLEHTIHYVVEVRLDLSLFDGGPSGTTGPGGGRARRLSD